MRIAYSLNKKRLVFAAVLIVCSLALCLHVHTTPKFTLVLCLCLAAGGFLDLKISGRLSVPVMPLAALAASLLTVLLAQEANGIRRMLAPKLVLMGAACVLLLILLLHCVLLCFSKKDMRPAIIVASGLLIFLSIVNFYLYDSRGTGLSPSDLLGAVTAMNVISQYRFALTQHVLIAALLYAAFVFLLTGIRVEPLPPARHRRITAFASLLLLAVFLRFRLGDPHSWQWQNAGAEINGFVLNFFTEINESIFTAPADYGAEAVRGLENRYHEPEAPTGELPHIIVIMSEAYADLRILGDLETDVPFMPFVDSLSENVIKGYALSSVYGGMTPNSEYEFLTGNSMAFLRPFVIPFMQLVRQPLWSLNAYLESLGYQSFASHPAAGINWQRDKTYPLFGFDRSEFETDYPEPERLGNTVRDDELFDHIIRHFEESAADGPQFLFTVTLQNHGGYKLDPSTFDEPVHVLNAEDSEADDYLSRMLVSDRSFQRLVEYFEGRDEHVIILLYGDHQPGLPADFLEALHGGGFDTLEEQMLLYQVPYLLWANYDIEEKTPGLTSINYLSNLLLETAEIPLSPFHQFLRDAQAEIPAINAFCCCTADGRMLPLTDAGEADQDTLRDYSILEYNAIFDRKGRSAFFFPAPEQP